MFCNSASSNSCVCGLHITIKSADLSPWALLVGLGKETIRGKDLMLNRVMQDFCHAQLSIDHKWYPDGKSA